MIKESRPVSMSEIINLISDSEKVENVKKFIKDFGVLDIEDAKKLSDEIRTLDIIKLKEEHIIKIVDFLPTDSIELNKVILKTSLDQDEINKILEITKKYK